MKVLPLLVLATLSTGCAGGALAPSASEQSRLQQAVALIRSSPERLPFADEPLAAWFEARVSGVYINERHPEFDAYRERETGRIFVRADVTERPIERLASTLLHEARHADMAHTCGLHDRSLEEWGAWAVQAWFLERHGFEGDAVIIRDQKICAH